MLAGVVGGGSVDTSVAQNPINGWVAAGWVTMFAGNQGSEIGVGMAKDFNKKLLVAGINFSGIMRPWKNIEKHCSTS